MLFREFDIKKFTNDAYVVMKTMTLKWTRDDDAEKKKRFFYRMMNLFFFCDENENDYSQTFKKKRIDIIKNSRRFKIEVFKTMI
jgi:hypothetical protein